MGGIARFSCMNCGYTEEKIGFGHGKHTEPHLQLYCCDRCKTVGSTWVKGDEQPLCEVCYEEAITPLEPNNTALNCPRCDTLAVLAILEDTWE